VRLIVAYGNSKASNYAAGLALNAFLTMFPLILGMLSVVGLVVRDPDTRARLEDNLASVFPSDAHSQIVQALGAVHQSAGILGIVALVGLLWSGTGLFAAMEFALGQVMGAAQRGTVRQRAMALVMFLIFLVALIVAVTATSVAAAIPVAAVGSFLVGSGVMTGLLVAIYRLVPQRTLRLRDHLPGAILAGALIELLTFAFPIYARALHGFNTYGQQFALFYLLATWLLFLCQLILLGAVYNRLCSGTPHDAGLLAEEPAKAKHVPPPYEAIEAERQTARG
jgi:membrane protein